MPDSSVNSWDSWFIFNLQKNKLLLLHERFCCTYIHGKGFQEATCYLVNWLLHYNVATFAFEMLLFDNVTQGSYFGCKFLFETHTLLEQCTYLGHLLLEAPQRICPAWSPSEHQLTSALSPIWGPRPKSRRPEEVFIVLMTAAHISPNVFSLQNFLSNILYMYYYSSLYIHHHSYLLYITFKQVITSFYLHDKSTLSFLQLLWIIMRVFHE